MCVIVFWNVLLLMIMWLVGIMVSMGLFVSVFVLNVVSVSVGVVFCVVGFSRMWVGVE